MINQLASEIEKLAGDHPFKDLKEWHLAQCIRQIRLRARKAMIPPFSRIEKYRGQGMLVSKLYSVLLTNNSDTIQEFLKDLSLFDARKLMWQRFTSSSFLHEQYFLPTPDELESMIRSQDLEIHLESLNSRNTSCDEDYWEIALEEARDRSKESGREVILEVLDFFLDEFTWWNTYRLGTQAVLEIRDPSGHGMRFDLDESNLIEFIEPDEEGILFTMKR